MPVRKRSAASRLLTIAAALMLLAAALSACAKAPRRQETPLASALAAYRATVESGSLRVMLSPEKEREALELISGLELRHVSGNSDGAQDALAESGAFDYRLFADAAEYAYSSASGALTNLSSGLCAFLPSERRQALNSILGIGALRGSAFPEGALPYRVTAARIDVCGPEPSIVLEYRGPDDKGISFSPYFSVWYAGESGMENVPGRLWETGPGTYYADAGCFITQTFSLADFDLSRPGLYRLCFYGEISGKIINDPPESDCYIEFEVSGSAEPAPELCDDERTLRLKYPYYFDLDTEHGLDVLIWQMAPGDYSCMIFPGSGTELSYREMIDLTNEEDKWPVDTETAKIILASYGLPRGRVRLLPFEHYHSSYLYRIDDAYMEELGRMFFGDG